MTTHYVILDSQDRYLTRLEHGKTRRGWSKHRMNAAVFDNRAAAEAVLLAYAPNHSRTARIAEVAPE